MEKIKITFLGTNGWYDTSCGNTICTLIETPKVYILLDAGNGIYKADRLIKKNKPVYLLLSHFHIDHIEGLHVLAKFRFPSLQIIGPKATRATMKAFLSAKHSLPLAQLPFPCTVHDVPAGRHGRPFRFQMLPLVHASPCYGYRLELNGKVISYCTDTGYCSNAETLCSNADVAILECAFLSGQESTSWPHLNPQLAAKLAVASGAKKLILTHFDAARYTSLEKRKRAQKDAQKIFSQTFAAHDGLTLTV